ncbi:MAG: hypothetical protein GY822_27880, partial [Deltaproteobacteria bacterium]|nr:hypothetical protein [Deltaproteobacteria bacterium]
MKKNCFSLVSALVFLASVPVWGQEIRIRAMQPIQLDATSLDLGFHHPTAESLQIQVSGCAPTPNLVTALDLALSRGTSTEMPFRKRIPLASPFPSDGCIHIVAEAQDGSSKDLIWDASSIGPSFKEDEGLDVRLDDDSLLLELPITTDRAQVQRVVLTLTGTSAIRLREVGGNVRKALNGAFAVARNQVFFDVVEGDGKVSVRVPRLAGQSIPPDGVVVMDATIEDVFGRTSQKSSVAFTSESGFDQLLTLSVFPEDLFLSQGYGQQVILQVKGNFMVAGEVNLTGSSKGVSYEVQSSSAESVITVTSSGMVVARNPGTATVTLSYGDVSETMEVTVAPGSELTGLDILPPSPTIEGVGGALQLRLQGTLSDASTVDLSLSALGTIWSTSAPEIIAVDVNGYAICYARGAALISARHVSSATVEGVNSDVSVEVDCVNAAPLVSLTAPAEVQPASLYSVLASASDDVSVSRVEFLIGNDVVATDNTRPYQLQLTAPEQVGSRFTVKARALDEEGGSAEDSIQIEVVPSSIVRQFQVENRSPHAGDKWIAGLPQVLSVTSRDIRALPESSDFAQVKFFIDDELVSMVTQASNERVNIA